MRTRTQRFADDAFQRVKARQRQGDPGRYGRFALSLPTLVRSAGLAQALAFAEAKQQRDLLDDLASTLGKDGAGGLLQASRELPVMEYMKLTREVLAAADWYKRYAQSILNIDPAEAADDAAGAP